MNLPNMKYVFRKFACFFDEPTFVEKVFARFVELRAQLSFLDF